MAIDFQGALGGSCVPGMYMDEVEGCLTCPTPCTQEVRIWLWGVVSGVIFTGGAMSLALFLRHNRKRGRRR